MKQVPVLCSMFNSINEHCPYGLRSAASNNLFHVQKVNILKELFYTLGHKSMEFSPIQH